jgi:hypothetical protein
MTSFAFMIDEGGRKEGGALIEERGSEEERSEAMVKELKTK